MQIKQVLAKYVQKVKCLKWLYDGFEIRRRVKGSFYVVD